MLTTTTMKFRHLPAAPYVGCYQQRIAYKNEKLIGQR
jgi:hypothetical protein